jgi:hypothetical protein
VAGLVYGTACAGGIIPIPHPPRMFCAIPYRGELVFCRTMSQIGICPAARVNIHGHFVITLPRGRYALLPAPGKGNIVEVRPRWVTLTGRGSLTIHAGITAKGLARLSSEV